MVVGSRCCASFPPETARHRKLERFLGVVGCCPWYVDLCDSVVISRVSCIGLDFLLALRVEDEVLTTPHATSVHTVADHQAVAELRLKFLSLVELALATWHVSHLLTKD